MLNTTVRTMCFALVGLLFITITGCAKKAEPVPTHSPDEIDTEKSISLAFDTKEHGAIATVKTYLIGKTNNDYPTLLSTLANDPGSFPLGVISLTPHRIEIADAETHRIKRYYIGSDLALRAGWSDEYIRNHTIVVLAVYTVRYDNTRVPYEGGTRRTCFFLIREHADSPWLIWQLYRARAGD